MVWLTKSKFLSLSLKSVEWICDPDTEVFLGYCFIEMGSHQEAEASILKLHKQLFRGKPLRVSFAREGDQRREEQRI